MLGMSLSNVENGMMFIMVKIIYGIKKHRVKGHKYMTPFQGFGFHPIFLPGALPRAGLYCPFGAEIY